jgi:hypothetical protein
VTIDLEISALLNDRRRGSPSPSASDINQRILESLHERGSLSAVALAEVAHEEIEHINGRLSALTSLGLLQCKKDDEGMTIYFLSTSGIRARGLAYLSIHNR